MFRRALSRSFVAVTLAACTFAPVASHSMSIFRSKGSTTQRQAKLIHVTLRNATNAPMNLLVQDNAITIAPNGSYRLETSPGTVVYDAQTKAVKMTISKDLNGGTLAFH